jgi:hypothetical protein
MYLNSTIVWKKAKCTYHKAMHTYYSNLYRDCLDIQMKELYYRRGQQHEQKIKDEILKCVY